jgi:hypothetical protein
VISRGAVVILSAIAVVLGGAEGATSAGPPIRPGIYVVRPDPRLCPSPLCGGYWVALANHGRTECSDGARRPQCYVARIVGGRRTPLQIEVPAGALVQADLESWEFESIGELGVLAAAALYPPAGTATGAGRYLRLVDTGIRCVRAPCFSYRATRVNGVVRTALSGVALGSARATPAEVARAEAALRTRNGLLARGLYVTGSDGGRVFHASKLFLRAPQPRV